MQKLNQDAKIHLSELQDSGLSIDWGTIQRGLEGFGPHERYHRQCLDPMEVQDYALGTFVDAPGTIDEDALFQIADANLTQWNVLNVPVEVLAGRSGAKRGEAGRSGVSRETAARKWRYACLKPNIEALLARTIHADDAETLQNTLGSTCIELNRKAEFWNEFVIVNPVIAFE